jgi:hypothetical protein
LDQRLYYQWSSDGGLNWTVTAVILRIFSRPWSTPFDMYDMASDSGGNIHLIFVGQQEENATNPGVYHLVWDGIRWSAPTNIFYKKNLYPEYPKIVIAEGNKIHAAWFTREGSLWDQTVSRHIWYSSSQTNTPAIIVTPRLTPTVPLPTQSPTPYPSATPRPTISSEGINVNSPTNEYMYLRVFAFVLAPVVLFLVVVIVISLRRTHKPY